jgi:nitroreductase
MATAAEPSGEKDHKEERSKWVGVYIGVLAVLLAICNVGGANATKDATHANIAAANTWSFFQAKNIRRNSIAIAADDLELMLASQPAMPEEAKKKFEDKIKSYRAQYQSLTTDPAKQEGLDELFQRGKTLEAVRDVALRQDPYFDWSQALLQIAIVLASVHLIIGNLWLLALSGGLGGLGTLLMLNGFTLAVRLPFLG